MPIIINYSLLPGLEKTGILAPLLPVTFQNGAHEFSTMALVDSGAQGGIISTIIADALNIKWHKTPRHIGLTASGSFIFHRIPRIEVEIFTQSFFFGLNVVEGINAFQCIMGRNDIFRVAKITFEGYKRQFHLEFRKLN